MTNGWTARCRDLHALRRGQALAGKLSLAANVKAVEEEAARFLKVHAVFLTNATAGFEIAYKFAGPQARATR